MSPAEQAQLHDLSREILAARVDVFQPPCIAHAWRSPVAGELALTMQAWIDLEAARSPLLTGGLPESDAEIEAAFAAFEMGTEKLSGDELLAVVLAMRRAIVDAFSAALKMEDPANDGVISAPKPDDGFGDWLPLLAFLVVECHLGEAAALALRADRAFMLLASSRANRGWRVAGVAYKLRGVGSNEPQTEA